MKNKAAIICIILCCVMFLSSCGMFDSFRGMAGDGNISTEESIENNTEANSYMTLTERQKSILRDEGLPEEYSELTTSQKSAIVAIEELLCYLEDKYDDEFTYEGYVSSLNFEFEPEHLTAYLGDPNDGKIVTVTRRYENKEYIYSDNYLAVKSETEYEEMLYKFLEGVIDEEPCSITVDIYEVTDSDLSIIARSTANAVIVLDNCFESQDDAYELVLVFGDWLQSLNPECQCEFRFIIKDKLDYVTVKKTDLGLWIDGDWQYSLDCSIDENGNLSIVKDEKEE